MTLQELKESIEDRTFSPSTMVIVSDDKFIPLMYLRELEKNLGYSMNYVESITDIGSDDEDIFGAPFDVDTKDIVVLNTDSIDFCNDTVFRESNVIIIANKISPEAKTFYKNILIEIPKIVDWQLKDMVYSYCKGVNTKYLDWLIKECNEDVNRLYNECLKLSIFREEDRPTLFDSMDADGAFDDLTSNTIFNLSNAIVKKDVNLVKSMYNDIRNIGVSDFGLLTVLYNNFMNVVAIQMGINPTAEKLGMKPNQFNAVRYNCGKYSNSQLVSIVRFLSELDFKIKSGELPTNILIDYMITSIMSF
jgi:hypothetical protein